jgi:hypothetical protein
MNWFIISVLKGIQLAGSVPENPDLSSLAGMNRVKIINFPDI